MLLCAYVIYFITNIICGHMCEKNQYEVTNIPKPLTNWSLRYVVTCEKKPI